MHLFSSTFTKKEGLELYFYTTCFSTRETCSNTSNRLPSNTELYYSPYNVILRFAANKLAKVIHDGGGRRRKNGAKDAPNEPSSEVGRSARVRRYESCPRATRLVRAMTNDYKSIVVSNRYDGIDDGTCSQVAFYFLFFINFFIFSSSELDTTAVRANPSGTRRRRRTEGCVIKVPTRVAVVTCYRVIGVVSA